MYRFLLEKASYGEVPEAIRFVPPSTRPRSTPRAVLTRLRREPSPADEAALVPVLAAIEDRALSIRVRRAPAVGPALARARVASSHALRSAVRARADWLRASRCVVQHVASKTPLSLDALRELNATLLGRAAPSAFRTTASLVDGFACPSPCAIESLVEPMLPAVSARLASSGVLFAAGLLYQWLVSVRPFAEANGRTARLAVDWLLGLHGHVPVSFDDAFDACVAVHGHAADADRHTPRRAAEVIGGGVLHSLDVLAQPA